MHNGPWGEVRLRLDREPHTFKAEVELREMLELLEALLDEEKECRMAAPPEKRTMEA